VPAVSAAGMVDHLDDAATDAFLQAATAPGLLAAELRQLGGAYATAPEDGGAVSELGNGFLLFAVGVPMGPFTPADVQASCAGLRAAMAPWLGERDYLGFTEQGGSAQRGFAPDVFARLVEIRERVDPQRRFVAPHRIG